MNLADSYCISLKPSCFNRRSYEAGFLGRPLSCIQNPGNGQTYQEKIEFSKLITNALPDNNINLFYPTCDHSGIIADILEIKPTNIMEYSSDDDHTTFFQHYKADGIIGSKYGQIQNILVAHTSDCGSVVGVNQKEKTIFNIHISMHNFWFVLNNFFKANDPQDCIMAIGPSAAGLHGCKGKCFEYGRYLALAKQKKFQEFSTNSCRNIFLDIRNHNATSIINFGELLECLLTEVYGVKEVDTSCNLCTICNPELFYSYRYAKNLLLNPKTRKLQLKNMYGNISYIRYAS